MLKFNFFWIQVRFSALIFSISFLLDIEIFLLFFGFFYIHIWNGFKSLLSDYIHLQKLCLFLVTLLKLFLIEFFFHIIKLIF